MSKKLIFVLIALTALCFALTACQQDGPPNGDPNETYYTVTFDSQGGTDVDSQEVMAGNPARAPTFPTRGDDIFLGWYVSADDDAELWDFATDRVNSDITLYAKWQTKTSGPQLSEPAPTNTLTYKLNEAHTGYIVTGDEGQATEIVIPSRYLDVPVVEIYDSAFAYSRHIEPFTSVTIPNSVTTIGKNAFNNQSELVKVNIGEDSELVSIGNNTFSGCHALESIYIPKGVRSIGDSVFNNCGGLNKIEVADENSVYSGEGNCLIEISSGLLIRGSNNSVIPNSVKEIAPAAFRMAKIKSVRIPKTVTKIGNYFVQNSSVEEIIFDGSEAEWAAVSKGKLWDLGNDDLRVIFSDQAD